MKCPSCGKELKEKTDVCPYCGENLEHIPSYEFVRVNTSSKEDRLQILKIALVTAAVLAFVGYAFVSLRLSALRERDENATEYIASSTSGDDGEVVESEESSEESTIEESVDDYPKVYDTVEVTASSFLTTKSGNTYPVSNLTDGKKKTAWSEGVSGTGVSESLTFTFEEKINLESIKIVNGYCKSRKTYRNNPRVKEVKVTFDDGKSERITLEDDYNTEQVIMFDEHHGSQTVTLEIVSVYSGRKFKDTSLSEVSFNTHEN